MPPPQITLYDESTADRLEIQQVAAYLACVLNIEASVRTEFVSHFGCEASAFAGALARCKVRNPHAPPADGPPMRGEVEFERRRLAAGNRGPFGIIYDGFLLQAALRELIPAEEGRLAFAHIVFTNRLVATWEPGDRYHLRAVICGCPALVSTSGLVEAPAKPKEFYLTLQALGRIANDDAAYQALKSQFGRRFLDHDDPRLTEVAKGYALQAAFYSLMGEAFCEERSCRLFNAHWQEEMLFAQVESGRLCERHRRLAAAARTL
jgi:hypothetical protein